MLGTVPKHRLAIRRHLFCDRQEAVRHASAGDLPNVCICLFFLPLSIPVAGQALPDPPSPSPEASIGNVMLHASPGFITLTDTRTLGTVAMIAEDSADRYLIMGLDNRTANLVPQTRELKTSAGHKYRSAIYARVKEEQ